MPPFPGEERLVTLYVYTSFGLFCTCTGYDTGLTVDHSRFTDCHYYFAQPTARPSLHRFDKASYFYVYYNSTRQTSRIEVANNPGTPEQDAFNGSLDTCRIVNSYKFPTLVTLIVDAVDNVPSPTSSMAGRDPEEWRLLSADPRDPTRMKHRLHTIDFYFWTQEDAKLVTDFFKRLLKPIQLDVIESKQPQAQTQPQRAQTQPQQSQQTLQPQQQQQQQKSPQPYDAGVSPVVQNLENVAISDPAYSNGQTRNSQNQPQSQPILLPPPPSSQSRTASRSATSQSAVSPSSVSQSSRTESRLSQQPERSEVDYTPIAYNPAAPAAPEKIAHREKTPPPEDGAQGTGLSAVALHDTSSTPGAGQAQRWGAPPASHVSHSTHWGSPPPSSINTYGPQASTSSLGYASSTPVSQYQQGQPSVTSSNVLSFAPPPTNPSSTQDPHRHSTAAEIYTPSSPPHQQQAVETPGSQFYNTIQQPARPLQHIQPQYADYLTSGGTQPGPQPPPGGWSNHSYAQSSQGSHHAGSSEYDVHSQVYRPTEEEARAHSHRKPSRKEGGSSSKPKSKFLSKFGINSTQDAVNKINKI